MKHVASDGSIWHIEHFSPSVAARSCDWQYAHEDYDGPEDNRCGFASSEEKAIEEIEELIEEEADDQNVPIGRCKRCNTPVYTEEGYCGSCEL